MPKAPESPLTAVTPLYPPQSGRFMLVYDLDDLGVDYQDVCAYYRMALSCALGGFDETRNRLAGIKPWTVASNGDVTAQPANSYLMRMICNVVQLMIEHAAENQGEPGTVKCVQHVTMGLYQFGDYELLVGRLADMAASVYRLLPPHVGWISFITTYQHLAYVYAGQVPQEDPCLTMSR